MRRLIAPLLLVAALGLGACGGDEPAGREDVAGSTADSGGDLADGGEVAAGGAEVAPPCPFTAEDVSAMVGQPMEDDGSCSFGDGKGVASVTVTTASTLAGATTYDYQHDMAQKSYDTVGDLDVGRQSYFAVKDIQGEAVVIADKGSYTIILSSFERLGASNGYEPALRALVDAALK